MAKETTKYAYDAVCRSRDCKAYMQKQESSYPITQCGVCGGEKLTVNDNLNIKTEIRG